MTYKIIFSQKFYNQIEEIFEYSSITYSKKAAYKYLNEIKKAINKISFFPSIGIINENYIKYNKIVRSLIIKQHTIIYEVIENNKIIIFHIIKSNKQHYMDVYQMLN